jgi:hypothetical protein
LPQTFNISPIHSRRLNNKLSLIKNTLMQLLLVKIILWRISWF